MTVNRNFIHDFASVEKHLKRSSYPLYKGVLRALCEDHCNHKAAQGLTPLLEEFDPVKLVDYADTLLLQKYSSATEHYVACQFALLIKKYPFPKGSFNPEEVAKNKFLAAEAGCKAINEDWNSISAKYCLELSSVRNFISYVIGCEPSLADLYKECYFGPGASIGVNGNATNPYRKLDGSVSVSPSAFDYFVSAISADLHLLSHITRGDRKVACVDRSAVYDKLYTKANFVDHNKVTFVPKTARTHRPIAVEPVGNGFLQAGAGRLIQHRLKRIGLDIQDQTLNQRLARSGSVSDQNPFCTIDLSSASDTISSAFCRDVLPQEWFCLLDRIRSKSFLMDGQKYPYHKFCSMGNGFCFPLETLLFSGICVAAGCGKPGVDFMVYGDDIIVRHSQFARVLELLNAFGFRENLEKTFSSGPFRESCGADYFGGVDVRPYTLDYPLDSLQNMFKFLNASLVSKSFMFFDSIRPMLLDRIPLRYRFLRPYPGPADTGIDSNRDEYLSSPHVHFKNGAWVWKELLVEGYNDPIREDQVSDLLMYVALRGSASKQPFALRRKTRTRVRNCTHSGAVSTWLPRPEE